METIEITAREPFKIKNNNQATITNIAQQVDIYNVFYSIVNFRHALGVFNLVSCVIFCLLGFFFFDHCIVCPLMYEF